MRRTGQFGEVSGQKVVKHVVLQGPPGKIARFGVTNLLEALLEHKEESLENKLRTSSQTLLGQQPTASNNSAQSSTMEANLTGKETKGVNKDYGKAVKADNAKVNIDLWDKQCSRILGLQGVITKEL